MPLVFSITHANMRKISGFLMFLGGIKVISDMKSANMRLI